MEILCRFVEEQPPARQKLEVAGFGTMLYDRYSAPRQSSASDNQPNFFLTSKAHLWGRIKEVVPPEE
jgi:hypothetical protein